MLREHPFKRRQNTDGPSYHEAFMYKEELVNTWMPASEVLPFKFGDDVLGIVAALGGCGMTFMFRKALKLRPFAKMTCYLPVFGISAISTFMLNSVFISSAIVKEKSCPLCLWTKANLGQLVTGILYPLIATPTVCFYMADRLMTYPVPPLVRAPRETFSLFRKIVSKNSTAFLIIGASNIIACSVMTYIKLDTFKKMRIKNRMLYQTDL